MNPALTNLLDRYDIQYESIAKSEKVKLLSRWHSEFPQLAASAHKGLSTPEVLQDNDADSFISTLAVTGFIVLPDDASAMPSLICTASFVPDMTELVSDTYTKCEELVLIDGDFAWSSVLVNHGAAGAARHFIRSGTDDR